MTSILTGPGCLAELAAQSEEMGFRRVLVIASDSSRPIAERVRNLLGRAWRGEFADVVTHVPAAQANAVVANAQEIRSDGVVTIGGGSATGLGKVVSLALGIPLVAVPVTYAGCEMTALYGVTTDHGFETGVNRRTRPRLVLYDPELCVSLAPDRTAACGLDAIGVCLDVLWQPGAPAAGIALAEEGLRKLWTTLPSLLARPADVALRQRALEGARLAGTALDAGGPGLYRRLSWALAAVGPVGAAQVSGWLLPRLAALNADRWNVACFQAVAGPESPFDALSRIGRQLGLVADADLFGLGGDDLRRAIALVAVDPPPNPVAVSEQGLREVLTAIP